MIGLVINWWQSEDMLRLLRSQITWWCYVQPYDRLVWRVMLQAVRIAAAYLTPLTMLCLIVIDFPTAVSFAIVLTRGAKVFKTVECFDPKHEAERSQMLQVVCAMNLFKTVRHLTASPTRQQVCLH